MLPRNRCTSVARLALLLLLLLLLLLALEHGGVVGIDLHLPRLCVVLNAGTQPPLWLPPPMSWLGHASLRIHRVTAVAAVTVTAITALRLPLCLCHGLPSVRRLHQCAEPLPDAACPLPPPTAVKVVHSCAARTPALLGSATTHRTPCDRGPGCCSCARRACCGRRPLSPALFGADGGVVHACWAVPSAPRADGDRHGARRFASSPQRTCNGVRAAGGGGRTAGVCQGCGGGAPRAGRSCCVVAA